MRSNCGVYVDAGYLLASAATRVTGTSLRNGVTVDYPKLLKALIESSERFSGIPVLRVNWYDAAENGIPDSEQERIGLLPKVKLRLGRFGFDGQQKGVDLRIGLDMVAHARNSAVETIVLVSGDDDLTEAVEEAQVHGVEVILLAVPNRGGQPHGVSRHLQRAADGLETLGTTDVDEAVRPSVSQGAAAIAVVSSPTPPPLVFPTPAAVARMVRPREGTPLAPTGTTAQLSPTSPERTRTDAEVAEVIDGVATKALLSFSNSATAEELRALESGRPSIPRDLDRALLQDLTEALSASTLGDTIRTQLRRRFWEIADSAIPADSHEPSRDLGH